MWWYRYGAVSAFSCCGGAVRSRGGRGGAGCVHGVHVAARGELTTEVNSGGLSLGFLRRQFRRMCVRERRRGAALGCGFWQSRGRDVLGSGERWRVAEVSSVEA